MGYPLHRVKCKESRNPMEGSGTLCAEWRHQDKETEVRCNSTLLLQFVQDFRAGSFYGAALLQLLQESG
ncbi:hypothetical protein BK147_10235 [Paenibacillus sp. FSL R7-0337]|nr:hypothetical protein BK147_10235 [Paenibacillus sp. FSL R7-0337]